MKLSEYLGLRGKWPPPAKAREPGLPLKHCRDLLVRAFCHDPAPSGPARVGLSTNFAGRYYIREIELPDEIAARVFCEFLNKHVGKTIDEISDLDVTFLG